MAEAVPVLHVASHRINVGDGALIEAIQRGLRRVAGAPIRFEDFDIVDLEPEFGGASLREVDLGRYRLVLVGGGGTIDNKRTRTASGMAFPMSGDEIRASPTPLAFVALGYNLFGGTRLRNEAALADVIRACAERGFPFSVRNDGSLTRLREALGAAAESVVEIPDPGFFVDVPEHCPVPQFSGRRPRILVQPAGDSLGFHVRRGSELVGRVRNRFPVGLAREVVGGLGDVVRWLVEAFDAEVVLAPHISKDLPLVVGILARLSPAIARKRVRVLGVADPVGAGAFFAAYAQADLVIGMRGHSVICACGLRVPCIGLSTHPKVEGFMAACDLCDWAVRYRPGYRAELERLSAELLTDPAPWLARRDAATAAFGTRFDDFLRRCWALVP